MSRQLGYKGITQRTTEDDMTEFNLPKEMAEAVLLVMQELKSLAKTGRNDHGRYNFAPVDDFYDAVHDLLPKYGLLPTADEVDSELVPMETATFDSKGNPTAKKVAIWIKSTWIFKLNHNGVTSEGFRRIVWVPTAGPQTAGIAQSYADKNFMRSLFKIRTGEYELDDMAPEPHGTPVKPEAPVQNSQPAKKPATTPAHDPVTGEVKTDSKTLATDIFKDILSAKLTGNDIIHLEGEIKLNKESGNLEQKHYEALEKVLNARRAIHQARTLEDIEIAATALSQVPDGFKKAKNIGDLDVYLSEKKAIITATQVTA
jgi:hypothetical protein